MNSNNLNQTVNHLFRNESGKMVAVLVKIFGSEHLQLAEDVVQDALIAALENWKFNGLPDNPKAWLYRVAKNKAIDIIRQKKYSQTFDFSQPSHQLLTSEYTIAHTMDNFWNEQHIHDDFLGMMYACCHPVISRENQITFILKTLCGFSIKEIAKAFLTTDETISKRLYRTKEFFRSNKLKLYIPLPNELPSKTDAVLNTIYLMFNEGYNSTHSQQLIREDIIEQTLFLCKALTENPKTRLPEVYALMALICFHAARSSSRINAQGELIILTRQDRNKWDKQLIQLGNHYLNKAAFGNTISMYHLEAAIAYEHCIAPTYEQTNWQAILEYYDLLAKRVPGPVVMLNRCIAIMELKGPEKAIQNLEEIKDKQIMHNYYLYYALRGELYDRLGNKELSLQNLLKARDLTHSQSEKIFLGEKITTIQTANN